MNSKAIREEFLRFFEERGHQRVPSSPVVPRDDPTLYFANAGMNQFKDVFLGLGRREYTRAVDTQKCIRVSGKHNDLEEVGVSPWHHTFFEMLGNWSFGDYFKKEAIEWAWELVTENFGLEKERLWATVYEGNPAEGVEPDVEAEKLWETCTDLLPGRVLRLPAKENFWEMGETGPCGPCSELHYFFTDDLAGQSADALRADSDDFVEIWNLVFIQYNRDASGALQPLPARHVDTGMGFERICSLLQGVDSNYKTDLFAPLIGRLADLSGREPVGDDEVAMQVIADHVRALTFAIADGGLPANDGAGYVLRRILRRAARYGRNLGMHEPFIHQLPALVADIMGGAFPEAVDKYDHVSRVIRAEEVGFGAALDRGLEIFERVAQKGEISGADAFLLHDTYGFPLDLTQLMGRERGLQVDTRGFEEELEKQRVRARQATRTHFRAIEGVGDILAEDHSRFVGYGELEVEAELVHAEIDAEGLVQFFLDQTPFYAEAGGQVGDRGRIEGEGFVLQVEDTVRARGGIMHLGHLSEGDQTLLKGPVRALVDAHARQAAARNHTATHLFHESLRRVLGDHVAQMGSLVSPERLRFDFSHFAAVEPEQLREIEGLVNDKIRADIEVSTFEEDLEKAKEMGAQALFGEKYDEQVRVVQLGDFSLELCGGTHVNSTGEIGLFSLVSEGSIATGTRRAEALTGEVAEQAVREERELLARMSDLLNAPAAELPAKLEGLLQRHRELERNLSELQRHAASQTGASLVAGVQEVEGIKVVAARVEVEDVAALRTLADDVRDRLGSGVGVMGAVLEGKVSFIAIVTDDLIQARGIKAGDIVKSVAQLAGGSGGGRPHLAQAGGRDPGQLDHALAAVADIVRQQLDH